MILPIAAADTSTAEYLVFIAETLGALVLIAAAAWALRKWASTRSGPSGRGRRMKFLERLSLNSRCSIHLVEVDDRTMLIGVSEHSVTLLKDLSASKADAATGIRGDS